MRPAISFRERYSGADPGLFLGGVHSSLALLEHQ